jgi:hypothetical protein
MALLSSRWHRHSWTQFARFELLLCSVLFVALGFVHHDHANLYADHLDECPTNGCWGLLPYSESLVITIVVCLLWWQQVQPPLTASWGVFHPPRPLLRPLS